LYNESINYSGGNGLKTRYLKQLQIFLIFLLSLNIYGATCPKVSADTPLCPDSGSTVLNEMYPAKAVVISAQGIMESSLDPNLNYAAPSSFIFQVMKSYEYGDETPQVVIPASEENYERVKMMLANELIQEGVEISHVSKLLKQVVRADSSEDTWQQDYFMSTVDLKTGNPQLREVAAYDEYMPTGGAEAVSSATQNCQITKSKKLETSSASEYPGAEFGANISALPAGLCLTGKSMSKEYAKQLCGSKDNVIQVDTSWLSVGVVDEIMKVVPGNFNDGRPKECNFSIHAASPQLAIDLLEKSNKTEFLIDGPSYDDEDIDSAAFYRGLYANQGSIFICNYINDIKSVPAGSKRRPRANARSAFIWEKIIKDIFLSDVFAESGTDREIKYCDERMSYMTNGHLLEGIKNDKKILEYNRLIQEKMDQNKAILKGRLMEKMPQCARYLDFVDVPDLFYGFADLVDGPNGKELPTPGAAMSFYPNPTSSVISNNTLIMSDPRVNVFKDYMNSELKNRGMLASYVDTFDYSHNAGGNIHSVSNTVRYCTPRL
jgi:hypothetical protein